MGEHTDRRWISRLCLLVALAPTPSHADGWVTVEAPAAAAVSDAQAHVFRPGAMPAAGVYAGNDVWAFGVRVRVGILRDGPAPTGAGMADPGVGGLAAAAGALRLGVSSGWAEVAAGMALTGTDLAPTIEAGIGWWFDAGRFDIGPSVRYLRLVNRDPMASLGSADLVLLGVELRFGHHQRRPSVIVAAARPVARVARAPHQLERDHVMLIDTAPACTAEQAGCPQLISPDLPPMIDDRVTLDDNVLFDVNRARVKHGGRRIVTALGAAWRAHPEWTSVTIEGHADVRGTDAWNLELSQLRAERVRAVLVRLGFDGERIRAIGYGRSRPRAHGTSEAAHQRNRRVEFVVDRSVR